MAKLHPDEVAFWRYELIQEALSDDLHRSVRGQILRQISQTPVRWPSGKTKRPSLGTLYRWVACYRAGGLAALRPKPRRDRGKPHQRLADEVVEEAMRLLREDAEMTFTFLLAVVRATFPQHTITRSTLARRVQAHPDYAALKRRRQRQRRRARFVAEQPHQIWHTDAKGPVDVRLVSGAELRFHVLSIIDDATRAILAAIVAPSPDLGAAVRVFRMAALRWGLPHRLYADRASIFDSKAFRSGLGQLGAHRIRTRPGNAEARGKIEAYHRVLALWFTGRLASQAVVDLPHLQQLLDGVIATLYQPHHHRGLQQSPQEALAGRLSARSVPPARLYAAFRREKRLKAHAKTGEVELAGTTYLVPDELRGQKLTFLLDPAAEMPPVVVDPGSGQERALRRAAIKPGDVPAATRGDRQDERREPAKRWGAGPLQTLYDSWQGRRLPQAEPGFGLPEIYALLTGVCGRHVPGSDAEAALVQRVYRQVGPLGRAAAEAAMRAMARDLGTGRPVKTYLDELVRRHRLAQERLEEPPP